MLNKPAILALADGTVVEGISVGASGDCVGELVFNTAMTGYQEMLTDPSYAKQIVMLTTAHVGNTGCNNEDMESSRVWATGLVMRNYSPIPSNYRSNQSLSDWLKKNNIVAIAGIDTRQLTTLIREKGALGCCISTNVAKPKLALAKAEAFSGLNDADLATEVSRQTIERWDQGRGLWSEASKPLHYHVVAYDFGVKNTILRILYDKGCYITLVPAQTSAEEVLALNPDGVFLSNGPGDPKACQYAIDATKTFLKTEIPVFGICLGFQILALASGAKSAKMKFGHHGANHPVIATEEDKQVFITSQNHGFTIDEHTLTDNWDITHRSLFDQTLQGIKHKFKPALGFQGHPEASPGPHDIEVLFDQFITMMHNANNQRGIK
ncbi:carbamoyl phosphate synthase, small subunit [Legionella beliardensis]|uniref:Carbamoyl phosphate synthase small chain n=1 Tax=Legionella beliardensis TaxID=91822 RepID=A0A378I0J3_9GAMM|nr:glutamine-hydrolyzing carbamoyl-phosphate synthase small subunit [Legionella beliardensis]STX28106.1 carbamoyl phosphate synthase, small subunit [Legionella beliardensis]